MFTIEGAGSRPTRALNLALRSTWDGALKPDLEVATFGSRPSIRILRLPTRPAQCCFGPRWAAPSTDPSLTNNHRFDQVISPPPLLVLREGCVSSPKLYRNLDMPPCVTDLTGFPPLFMQAVSGEMLRDETLRVAAKAFAAEVDVAVELWAGVPTLSR